MKSDSDTEIDEVKESDQRLIDKLEQYSSDMDGMILHIMVKLQQKNKTIESLKEQVTNSEGRLNHLENNKSDFQINASVLKAQVRWI